MSCNKTISAFVLVNIIFSQTSKVMFTVLRLTNPDVNLKRMYKLYSVYSQFGTAQHKTIKISC